MSRPKKNESATPAKEKLLQAAFSLVRSKGFAATTVDDLCREAGVTKGTFFHYFAGKEEFGAVAACHWSKVTGRFFQAADYHKLSDPFERFVGYVRFRKEILKGEIPEFTCLAGTMVQETYHTHEGIRKACRDSIFGHAETLETDIEAAKKLYAPEEAWTAESLALHTQAVLQGAFILAKAGDNPKLAADSVDHLVRYIYLLFNKEKAYV